MKRLNVLRVGTQERHAAKIWRWVAYERTICMHEDHDIEQGLKAEAARLSEQHGGAPVVIVVGGDTAANIPRTMTASSIKGNDIRLRDLLGILQTSIQIESWKHFGAWK